MSTQWFLDHALTIETYWQDEAEKYQLTLTKPPGSLGRLESLAVQFSGFQQTLKPAVESIHIAIMAGDHGIAEEGVSVFPQAVTGEMIKNFASGGAAIAVLAKYHGADLTVYNTGSVDALPPIDGVLDCRVAAGTSNFLTQAAMTKNQCEQALAIGRRAIEKAANEKADLFVAGEMGIANTTSAACLVAKLLDQPAVVLAGPGTGLDIDGVSKKATVIEAVLTQHAADMDAFTILQTFGGFEIAALVGAYIHSAQQGLPAVVDGYIATAAALIAVKINPSIQPWLLASHESAEPAHKLMLEALGLEPLVKLDMRLGEGSGAAIVIPLIKQACLLQANMATFAQAGVTDKVS